MKFGKSTLLLASSLCLHLGMSTTLPGQTNQGVIAGNVLDSTGAAVPDVQIKATNASTGSVYTTRSTSAGSYRFPSIELGRYTVSSTAQGFKTDVRTGVEVRVGSVTSLDITVAIGGTSDTVTVASDAPQIETQSSDVGGTVNAQQIIDLPLALGGVGAMRSPEAFVFLIPGTAGPGTANNNNGIFISKIGVARTSETKFSSTVPRRPVPRTALPLTKRLPQSKRSPSSRSLPPHQLPSLAAPPAVSKTS